MFRFILTDRVVSTSDVIYDVIRTLGDFPSLEFYFFHMPKSSLITS